MGSPQHVRWQDTAEIGTLSASVTGNKPATLANSRQSLFLYNLN